MKKHIASRSRGEPQSQSPNHNQLPSSDGLPLRIKANPRAVDPDSKWVRLPKDRETLRGFSRSYLYQLCVRKLVKSVVVTYENRRGCRLIYLPSIDEFLEKLNAEQNSQERGEQQ